MLEGSSHPRFFSSSIYGVEGPIHFGSTSNKRKYNEATTAIPAVATPLNCSGRDQTAVAPHRATSTALTKSTSIPENSIRCALGTVICVNVCATRLYIHIPNLEEARKMKNMAVKTGYDGAGVSDDMGKRNNEQIVGSRVRHCQLRPQILTRDKGSNGAIMGDEIRETAHAISALNSASIYSSLPVLFRCILYLEGLFLTTYYLSYSRSQK